MSTQTKPRLDGENDVAKVVLGLGLAAALAGRASAQTGQPPGSEVSSQWVSPLKRLVRRTTYGLSVTELQRAERLGFEAYLDVQLAGHHALDVRFEERLLKMFPRTGLSPYDLYDVPDDWMTTRELQMAGIMRTVFSPYQLVERMVEFWTDHFNVYRSATLGRLLVPFVRDTIRPRALGKFPDLLSSVAHSPAMLTYLNNDENEVRRTNINFARELFELHTMGTGGGYTTRDLEETSRVFTGWKWVRNEADPRRGLFWYDADHHHHGNKTVMGHEIVNGGYREGGQLLAFLGSHRNTAKFISKKLVQWFLGSPVNPQAWQAAEQAYNATGGDVRTMLRAILTPDNLMASNAKFKRPLHYMASAIRAALCGVTRYDYLLEHHLRPAGHAQYEWFPPNGYPDHFEYWGKSLSARLGFAFSTANNSIVGVTTRIEELFGGGGTVQGVFDALNDHLFLGEIALADRVSLVSLIGQGVMDRDRLRAALAFSFACPSFQWY